FVNLVFTDTLDGALTSDTITGLYNDTYYWRVRAIDNLGNQGTFGTARGFVTDTIVNAVTLTAPANAHETTAIGILVSWVTVGADSVGVDSYAIEVATNPTFSNMIFTDTLDGALSSDTLTGLYNDTYHWRIRAVDNLGNAGPYSDTRGFVTDTIVNQVALSYPADRHDTTVINILVGWSAVSDSVGVDSYHLEVATNLSFTNVTFTDTLDGLLTSDTVTGLYNDTYYWRVRATDDLGNIGPMSDTRAFLTDTLVGKVTLALPLDDYETKNIEILFTWNAVLDSSGIDSYAIEVSLSPGFETLAFKDTIDGALTSDTAANLTTDTFYWRVRAIDQLGNMGIYSDTRRLFIDTTVDPVTLSLPADGHETNVINFLVSWQAIVDSSGIDSYSVEVSRDTAFLLLVFTDTVDGVFLSDTITGLYNDTYYWRVRGTDNFSNEGPFLTIRGFVTDTIVNTVSLSYPAAGHETSTANFLAGWAAVTDSVGIDSYVMEVSRTTAFTTLAFVDTIDGVLTSDTITGLYNDTYYWRVQAIDNLGNRGTFPTARGFVLDTDVDTVTLVSPANGTRTGDTTPTFTWQAVADSVGIDSYAIEVSKSPYFLTMAYSDTISGALTSNTPDSLFADTYYWRVRAVDKLRNSGAFGDTFTLQIDTGNVVTLIAPIGGNETNVTTIVFLWGSLNAETYTWQLARDSNFTSLIAAVTDTTETTVTRSFTVEDTYYWRVIGRNSLNFYDTQFDGFLVDTSVRQVTAVAPANGHETTNSSVVVSWSALSDSVGIDSYVLDVSISVAFSSVLFTDTLDANSTSDTITGLYNDTYYWRVRGIDHLRNVGTPSTTRGFVLDTHVNIVVLNSPADSEIINDTRPVLTWNALSDSVGVDSYALEVSLSKIFSTLAFADTISGSRTSDTPTALAADTYYWRVRAIDRLGNRGAYSDTFFFSIDTTQISVTLVSPASGHSTNVIQPYFAWTGNAETYTLQLSFSSVFTSVASATTVLTTNAVIAALTVEDTYFWRVLGRNTAGTEDTSSVRGFLFDTGVGKVTLSLPLADTLTQDTTPTFTWVAVSDSVGIDSYVLEISDTVYFVTTIFADTIDGAFTSDTYFDTGLAADTYYWRVRAIDHLGNVGPYSDTRAFGVDTGSAVQYVGTINIISGNHQLAQITQTLTLTLPIRLQVIDTRLTPQPVPYSPVTFTIARPSSSGGYFGGVSSATTKTSFTDTEGYISETFTLGAAAGVYEIKATSDSNTAVSAIFLAYADGIDVAAAKWKMVTSNKVTLSASSVDALIKDDLTDALVFWWDENASADPIFNKYIQPTTVSRGRAYWVYSATGGRLVTQGTEGFDTLAYQLNTAWNMVGNGQYFFVDWDSSVRFKSSTSGLLTPAEAATAGLIENVIYWYNGNGYSWGPDPLTPTLSRIQLKPMVGFALYALQSCSMYVYPNPSTPSDTAAEIWNQAPKFIAGNYDNTSDQDWFVRVTAQKGQIQDVQNYIGVKATPADAALASRREPPPVATEYLSVSIEDPAGVSRAASFVDPIATLQTWNIDVATDLNGPVLLSLDGIGGIPSKYAAFLVGGPQGPMDLRKQTTVLLSNVGGLNAPSQVSVLVGMPELLAAYLAAPLSKEHTFVYPNPGPDESTGKITFKYNLGATAPVTIRIFDVGGRLVRQIETTGFLGSNLTQWDTTDRHGQRLGSGVYIYIIQSSGTKLVDKLAIVR
ncbi:T9SS type A sorting domain-containing protein, partial [bacterium]|nr:T9SS type A sorting domain-containing protein [bacterium]